MKRIILIFLFFLTIHDESIAQRYLTPVFQSTISTLDIQYGTNNDFTGTPKNLLLDFYEPTNDTANKRPLLIYVHGGGFVDTNQSKSLVHIKAFCESLALRGYVVASINYRLDTFISNRAVINAMHDAKAAVRFFRANALQYKVNPDLIFIGGESAGAITALTTTYINDSSEISYPSTLPLATNQSVEGLSGNSGFSSDTKAVLCFCGGTKTILNEALFDTTAIDAGDQPILFVHGTNDFFIPVASSLEIAQRVTNLGIPNLFYSMNGAGHCPWIFPLQGSWNYLDTLIDYTVPFLYACVQGSTGINNSKLERLKVFPNPSNSIFTIRVGRQINKPGELYIFSSKGLIQKRGVKLTNDQYSLDLSALVQGLYYLKLQIGNKEYVGSVLKN